MKTKSFFFSLVFAATAFAFLTNCSGNKKDESAMESHDAHSADDANEHAPAANAEMEASEPQFQVDQAFQQQLANVFASYASLKEAFVASDLQKVKTEASNTSQAISKVDMKLLSGAAHNDWMNYLSSIQRSLKEIQATSDIEGQRSAFSDLSDALYKSIKAYGVGGKEVFYDFCPMAFNNEGAYWLTDQEQIRNPYFGDKMLTCGEVKEKLK